MTACLSTSGWSSGPVESSIRSPTLVIGLGNPILGDDGVGWRVAEGVRARIDALTATSRSGMDHSSPSPQPQVEIDFLAVGGLALMERLVGYRRAIIIDALTTGHLPAGQVTCFPLSDLPERAIGHLASAHDTSLQNALRVAQAMGAEIPDEIIIIGIETDQVYDFSEEFTLPTCNAIPVAIDCVMELLK